MLAVLRAGDVPEYHAHGDATLAAAIGYSCNGLMPSSYAARWDKRDEYEPRDDDDQDWIGEDATGVWMRRHPIVALSMHPRLVGVVTAYNAGCRELSRVDYMSMSAFEIDATCVMIAASARAELARAKNRDKDGQP